MQVAVAAPQEQVWSASTTPEEVRQWVERWRSVVGVEPDVD